MLYDNIIKLCRERNIPVYRVERESGLGNATIRGWKTGDAVISKVKKVADFFGVTIDELMKE